MVENVDEVDGLQSWLEETDFSHSTIVYVETAAPTTCYTEVGVSHLAVENGQLTGRAKAIDTSTESESCGQAETYPSAFVRISSDDLPDETTFTVTDGWGESSSHHAVRGRSRSSTLPSPAVRTPS